jgi:hypothetical protein
MILLSPAQDDVACLLFAASVQARDAQRSLQKLGTSWPTSVLLAVQYGAACLPVAAAAAAAAGQARAAPRFLRRHEVNWPTYVLVILC